MKALELAKTNDNVESLIFIKDDNDAKRLLVAWMRYRPQFKDFECEPKVAPEDAFELAWDSAQDTDFDRLARIAGLPHLTTKNQFMRLVSAGLLYPDGTISKNALIVIQAEMKGHLRTLFAQSAQPDVLEPPPPEPRPRPRPDSNAR